MKDVESPIQDDDIEMADLRVAANHEAKLRKKGICAHSWNNSPNYGQAKCYNCGEIFVNKRALWADRERVLRGE